MSEKIIYLLFIWHLNNVLNVIVMLEILIYLIQNAPISNLGADTDYYN